MRTNQPAGRITDHARVARLPALTEGRGEWVGPISDAEYDEVILQLGGVDGGGLGFAEDDDLEVVYLTEDATGEDLPAGEDLPILAVLDPAAPGATCYRLNPSPALIAAMPCSGGPVAGGCDYSSTAYVRGEFFCAMHQVDRPT